MIGRTPFSDMSFDEFDIQFKAFTRFLKDIGKYSMCMAYLFPYGRTKREMYNEIIESVKKNQTPPYCDFSDILSTVSSLGLSFKEKGIYHYFRTIQPIADIWKEYYRKGCIF